MQNQRGFTLVELSIVLVILGLLIGGVLTGQSLIRAAELRSIATQAQRYTAAVQTFRDKYFGIPGDITNATSYWGTDPGGCPPAANTVTKAETCNGNGDGKIATGSTEMFLVWQHLADAGLIEGQYTGVFATAGNAYHAMPGRNVPPTRISGGMVGTRNLGTVAANAGRFTGVYGNHFQFGTSIAGSWNDGALLKSEEAYNIDMKMDDGKPSSGSVVSNYNNSCTDSADGTGATANYLLTTSAIACYLHFMWDGSFSR